MNKNNFDNYIYGEIYFNDNETPLTLSATPPVQIVNFDTNGWYNKTIPDYTQNHIIIEESGIYKVAFCWHLSNGEAVAHTVDITMYANNGTEEFLNVHSHRKLAGGTGDIGSMSGGGIVELENGETIELWATSTGDNKDVIFDDIAFSVVRIG